MEHEYRTVNGSELKEARKALGARVNEVASELGMNTATVWRWEKETREHGQLDADRYLAALARIAEAGKRA